MLKRWRPALFGLAMLGIGIGIGFGLNGLIVRAELRRQIADAEIRVLVDAAVKESAADAPQITPDDAYALARTYVEGQWTTTKPGAFLCFHESWQNHRLLTPTEPRYLGNRTWSVITAAGCGFLVDDRTGKVTGP